MQKTHFRLGRFCRFALTSLQLQSCFSSRHRPLKFSGNVGVDSRQPFSRSPASLRNSGVRLCNLGYIRKAGTAGNLAVMWRTSGHPQRLSATPWQVHGT